MDLPDGRASRAVSSDGDGCGDGRQYTPPAKSIRVTTMSCAAEQTAMAMSAEGSRMESPYSSRDHSVTGSKGLTSKSVGSGRETVIKKTKLGEWPKVVMSRFLTILSGIDPVADREEQMILEEIRKHERHDSEDAPDSSIDNAHSFARGNTQIRRLESVGLEAAHECHVRVFLWCRALVESRGFACFINLMIILSAILMGVQTDPRGRSLRWLSNISEQIFTGIFFIEMCMQIFVLRYNYFRDLGQFGDFIIVWTSVVSAWVMPIAGTSSDTLRAVKIFRLLRLLRILRIMKAIPELRMVLEGLVSSIKALFWVIVLLFIIIYSFSIFCVEIVGSAEAGFPGYTEDWEEIRTGNAYRLFNNYEYFGDIQRAFLTCLSLAFLVEWDAMRPVWEYQRIAVPVFLALIFVSSFGIVNVIIGVICESTTASMMRVDEAAVKKDQLVKMRQIKILTDIVWQADKNHDGVITRPEMLRASKNPEILDELRQLGLPKGFTFEDFHTMLNLDGKDGLLRSEFVDGMHRLVFSSDFQKACLTQLGLGQVKCLNQEIAELDRDSIAAEFKRLRRQNRRIKRDILAEIRGRPRPRRRRKRSVADDPETDMGGDQALVFSSSDSEAESEGTDTPAEAEATSFEVGSAEAMARRRGSGCADVHRNPALAPPGARATGSDETMDVVPEQAVAIHLSRDSGGLVCARPVLADADALIGPSSEGLRESTQEIPDVADTPRDTSCPTACTPPVPWLTSRERADTSRASSSRDKAVSSNVASST